LRISGFNRSCNSVASSGVNPLSTFRHISFPPADIDSIKVLIFERKVSNPQSLTLRACNLYPIVAATSGIAVELNFVNPTRAFRRLLYRCCQGRFDEARKARLDADG
jgi:hypothetical protein